MTFGMNLSQLSKIVSRGKKRLGRGHGSGKVKTSGRGTKGQKAREKIRSGFEGGQLPIIKRLPLLRGKGKNKPLKRKPQTLRLSQLTVFLKGATVTLEALKKQGLIEEDIDDVKVLAGGKLSVSLTVALPCSKEAQAAIEKAGGTVVR